MAGVPENKELFTLAFKAVTTKLRYHARGQTIWMSQYRYYDAKPICKSTSGRSSLSLSHQSLGQRRGRWIRLREGATCNMLSQQGFEAVGVDPSESGVLLADKSGVNAHVGSAYDDLASIYGTFPLVVSLEVIEHCMEPRKSPKLFTSSLLPEGMASFDPLSRVSQECCSCHKRKPG